MFDEGFDFRFIQKRKIESNDVICEYHYSFFTSKKRYVALVEEYAQNVFAIKFYPASFKNNNNRFNLIVDDFEASKVIRTSVNIMLSILDQRPEASFVWVGSHTQMKSKHEAKTNTQRFRIYKYCYAELLYSARLVSLRGLSNKYLFACK